MESHSLSGEASGTQVGDGKVKLDKARAGAGQSIRDGGLTDDDGQREKCFRLGCQLLRTGLFAFPTIYTV